MTDPDRHNSGGSSTVCLHGLNALYLPDYGWYRGWRFMPTCQI